MLWAGVIWALLLFHKKIQFTKTMVNIIFQFTVLTDWGKDFSPNVTSNTSSKYILSFNFTDKYFINVFLGFGDMFWWPTMTPKQDQGQVIQIITSGHRWWPRGFPNDIYRRLFFNIFKKLNPTYAALFAVIETFSRLVYHLLLLLIICICAHGLIWICTMATFG